MTTVINSNDINLEYRNECDFFQEVYYNGQPFTGLVIDGNEQTDYVNGNAHGKYVVLYEDGSINTVASCQNGKNIERKSFYTSGEILEEETQTYYKLWNYHGQLILEFDLVNKVDKTYFTNGNLKSIHEDKNEEWKDKYFTKTGELAYTQLADKYSVNHYPQVIYEYDVLLENYFDLLYNDYPIFEFKQSYQQKENHRTHLIWLWFWEVFDKDQKQYFEIVNNLMKHPDAKVLDKIALTIVLHRFEPYIEKEKAANAECYKFIAQHRGYQRKRPPYYSNKKVTL